MRFQVGDEVTHPDDGKPGMILDIRTNPACLMRHLVIEWNDGETEEVEELLFGPLED